MRNFIISTLLLFSVYSFSQDYQLFPNQYEKLFSITNTMESSFDLSFDSVISISDTVYYYNYKEIFDEYIISDSCIFWGGNYCYQQDKPSWIGSKIIMTENDQYLFFNAIGDTLRFNFQANSNTSQVFYEDETQSFQLEYLMSVYEFVVGEIDSIRIYKIIHYDNEGNIINSELNENPIQISKTYGLKNFFKVDQFPNQLQPLNLIGMSIPYFGFNHINQAMLHDHEIGDEIQYEEMRHRQEGSPDENYTKYTKYVFLNRWDANDSVHYLSQQTIHYKDSISQQIDTIIMSYSYMDTLAKIPFQKPNQSNYLFNKSINRQYFGELQLITYSLKDQYLVYCAEDNCWGPYDTNGPPRDLEIDYVIGLGLFNKSYHVSQPPPEGYYYHNRIIYFKKWDFIYGDDVILGFKDYSVSTQLEVFPNPAKQRIFFKNPNQEILSEISIFDLSGKLIHTLTVNYKEYTWDCSQLEPGVYIYQSKTNGDSYRGKLIIQ